MDEQAARQVIEDQCNAAFERYRQGPMYAIVKDVAQRQIPVALEDAIRMAFLDGWCEGYADALGAGTELVGAIQRKLLEGKAAPDA